ncbi:MAG: CBS domain-containing protein [Actinobacteria bacterium]|nr:CBS domain-containing protein [Actinomycetota bacterium]
MTARDIMKADVVTIGPTATVRELAELLSTHEISGVPVVNESGDLVGVVTEGDVILQDADLHFPHYLQFLDSIIYLESVRKFEERFRKTFGNRVADVMSTDVVTVSPDASIHEVTTLMADNGVNRVPVLEEGRLVGIITRGDVVRAIAGRAG